MLILLLIAFAQGEQIISEKHTSAHLVQHLLAEELTFLTHLQKYTEELEERLKRVRSYQKHVYSKIQIGTDFEQYVGNPLNAFGVIKRTSYDFINKFLPIINNDVLHDLEDIMNKYKDTKFPNIVDYH